MKGEVTPTRARRVALSSLAALGVASVAGFLLFFTPVATTPIARWAFTILDQRYGVVAEAEELRLDLFRIDVRIRGLRLAARDRQAEPFLTVEDVSLELPWSILWGEPTVESIQLRRPRLSMLTTVDGLSNLPNVEPETSRTDATAAPPNVPVGALEVEELALVWRDETRDLGFSLDGLSLTLDGADGATRGPLSLEGQGVVTRAGRTIPVSRLDGTLAFDGSTLGVEQVVTTVGEHTVVVNGRIEQALGDPRVELSYDATLDLASLAAWFDTAPGVVGGLGVSGGVSGAVSEPRVEVRLDGRDVAFGELAVDELRADARWADAVAVVDRLTARVAAGELSGRGRFAVGENETPSTVELSWSHIDPGQVALPVSLPPALIDGVTFDGEVAASWTALDFGEIGVEAELRTTRGDEGGVIRLTGTSGVWRLAIDHVLGAGLHLTGAVDTDIVDSGLAAAVLEGAVTVRCLDLGVCADAVSVPTDEATLGGTLTAELAVTGTIGDPRLTGSVTGPALTLGGMSGIELRAETVVDREHGSLTPFALHVAGNTISGALDLLWATGALRGHLDAALDDLSAFDGVSPPDWKPGGGLTARVDLAGTLEAPSASVRLDGRDVRVAGQTLDRVRGTVTARDSRVETDGFEVVLGTAVAEMSGHYDVVSDDFGLRVRGEDLTVTPLFPGTASEVQLEGRFSVDADAAGTLAAPRGHVAVESASLSWGDYPLGPVRLKADVGEGRVMVAAELPELATTASGRLTIDGDRVFDGTLDIDRLDLDRLDEARVAAGRRPVSGIASATARIHGDRARPEATVTELTLGALEGRLGEFAFALRRGGAVRYADGALEVDPLEVVLGGAVVSLAGRLDPDTPASLTGRVTGAAAEVWSLASLVPGAGTWHPRVRVDGDLVLELDATGDPWAPSLGGEVRLTEGVIGVDDLPPLTAVDLAARYREDVLVVERFLAEWQDATFAGEATVPGGLLSVTPGSEATTGTARAELSITSLTPAAFQTLLPEDVLAQMERTLDATLSVEADAPRVDAVRATLVLPTASMTLAGVPLAQRRPTRFELDEGTVRVAEFDWGNTTDYVTVGGRVVVEGAEPIADLTVTGEGDLRTLSVLTPGVAAVGHALVIANVTGPLLAPALAGAVELTDGEFRVAEPRLVVSELTGALVLQSGSLVPHELRGQVNGGPLQITGAVGLTGFRPEGAFTLTGRDIALEIPRGLRTEVDADLTVELRGDETTVVGTANDPAGAVSGADELDWWPAHGSRSAAGRPYTRARRGRRARSRPARHACPDRVRSAARQQLSRRRARGRPTCRWDRRRTGTDRTDRGPRGRTGPCRHTYLRGRTGRHRPDRPGRHRAPS